jgi:hypothetical protein
MAVWRKEKKSASPRTYKTKSGTLIKETGAGRSFTHKAKTKSGGRRETTYTYPK